MEIKAKCRFDLDSFKALTRLMLFKKADPKKRMIVWTIVYAVLFAIVLSKIIVLGISFGLLISLIVVIFVYLLGAYWYFILPKIQYKSSAKMQDAENEYVFCDNILKVCTKHQGDTAESEVEYSMFVRVYETTKYLFLYATNKQFLIVDKNTIEGGTMEEIRHTLSAFVKDKYCICNY